MRRRIPVAQFPSGKGEAETEVAFLTFAAAVRASKKEPVAKEFSRAVAHGPARILAEASRANPGGKERLKQGHEAHLLT